MRSLARIRKIFRRLGYNLSMLRDRLLRGRVRPRVVFIHTPKTGGSSISSYFKEYVGSKRSGRVVRYDDFIRMEPKVFAAHARAARFVMGHMPWSAFELCRDDNTYAFTVLRDPYDRLRSLYHFIVNLPASYKREEEINRIQKMSLREFLESSDPEVRFYTDNYLARQFAGSLDVLADTADARRKLAVAAIHNMSSIDLVGFNDDLDEAFLKIAEVAGLPPPAAGRRVNVTASLATSDEKRAAAQRAFDDELRALAGPLVEADMMVYEHFLKQRTR